MQKAKCLLFRPACQGNQGGQIFPMEEQEVYTPAGVRFGTSRCAVHADLDGGLAINSQIKMGAE